MSLAKEHSRVDYYHYSVCYVDIYCKILNIMSFYL